MKYTQVKNPKWSNPEHTTIDCEVDFDDLEYDFVPFTANPLDLGNPSSKQIFDECVAGQYGVVAEYLPPPVPEPIPPTAEENKQKATALLQNTDWVNQPDVYDPTINPHLLNRDEFIAYRSALRAIAVNPTEGFITFPTKPQEQWSN